MNTVTFVEAVGVAPGTTSLTLRGACGNGLGVSQCLPEPLPIHVAPNQSTMAAYKAVHPHRWAWWTDPATSGAGLSAEGRGGMAGLAGASGDSLFRFMIGAVLGVGLAYAGTYAYGRWKRR